MRTAIYPGTFDPITNGHIDLVKRSLVIFDKVIITIGVNSQKKPLFTIEERVNFIKETFKDVKGVEVDCFNGLLVNYVVEQGIHTIIRGLRAISDFEYEFQIALMNRRLQSSVETVFLLPSEEYVYLTSSIVKEVSRHGGDISSFVPSVVLEKLKERFVT